ncbi:VOC family protein [Streptomyces sp. SID2888]|uniref:VOC family protein n=1 Tax=Streptomyces sp. SID2888 TaxID=2690256 RepID=UPI001367D2D1|nr:VOC family protein [Streptomyces sp. SID2888]
MFYHVCFVVPDIEQTMEDLGRSVGVEWSGILEDSLGEWEYRLAFSRGGPPYLELVQGPPGSPWDSSRGARCHHLGFWTKDVEESSRWLADNGFEMEFSACPLGRPYTYHKVKSMDVGIELMDISRQRRFLDTWNPGGESMSAFDA